MTAYHTEIEPARFDAFFDDPRVRDLELQLDVGVASAEVGDDAGHHVDAGGRARPDHQRAVVHPVQIIERLPGSLDGQDSGRRVLLEDSAGLRQRDLAAATKEQLLAELQLQLRDVLGQGGLRGMDALRRPAEAPLAGDG